METLRFPVGSLPSRGAWIEIYIKGACLKSATSLPSRGAWIEIAPGRYKDVCRKSLPSRGAWIEMQTNSPKYAQSVVAPLTGSVD